MSGEVEKCPILHDRPKFDVFTLNSAAFGFLLMRLVRYLHLDQLGSFKYERWWLRILTKM